MINWTGIDPVVPSKESNDRRFRKVKTNRTAFKKDV